MVVFFDKQVPEEPKPVEKAPEFLVMLEPVKVKEGEPVTLTCQVTGSPEPELTWLVEKRQIVPVKNRSVMYWSPYYIYPHISTCENIS